MINQRLINFKHLIYQSNYQRMNIKLLLCTIVLMQCIIVSKASMKDDTANHTFKIVGDTKITTDYGEKTVEYDTESPDHLFISSFNKNGIITVKRQFLFTGKKFNLSTDFVKYVGQKEIVSDGITTEYREDGSIKMTSNLQKGELTLQTYYYANGQKELQIPGNADQMNGEYKMWYPNGGLSFSGCYKNRVKEGTFIQFDESGKELKKGNYQNGKLVSGDVVVQDIVFDNPDVEAKYPEGEAAFDEYLTQKAAKNGAPKGVYGTKKISLDLQIDKTGKIVAQQNISASNPAEAETIKLLFADCPLFNPAMVETVPVQSLQRVTLTLSNNGIKMGPEEKIYDKVEEMPEFPGGTMALRSFISSNIRYPKLAAESNIQGRVYVSFVVDVDGKVTDATIARGVHPLLDSEALRIVRLMPSWKPGTENGKAVKVSYTVPISFMLQSPLRKN